LSSPLILAVEVVRPDFQPNSITYMYLHSTLQVSSSYIQCSTYSAVQCIVGSKIVHTVQCSAVHTVQYIVHTVQYIQCSTYSAVHTVQCSTVQYIVYRGSVR
jgi:hypothetical protein